MADSGLRQHSTILLKTYTPELTAKNFQCCYNVTFIQPCENQPRFIFTIIIIFNHQQSEKGHDVDKQMLNCTMFCLCSLDKARSNLDLGWQVARRIHTTEIPGKAISCKKCSLERRRLRDDLAKVYRIMSGIDIWMVSHFPIWME